MPVYACARARHKLFCSCALGQSIAREGSPCCQSAQTLPSLSLAYFISRSRTLCLQSAQMLVCFDLILTTSSAHTTRYVCLHQKQDPDISTLTYPLEPVNNWGVQVLATSPVEVLSALYKQASLVCTWPISYPAPLKIQQRQVCLQLYKLHCLQQSCKPMSPGYNLQPIQCKHVTADMQDAYACKMILFGSVGAG